MADIINIEILEDGTVKFETDKISDARHVAADQFLTEVEELLGGPVDIKQKKKHHHVHTHNHVKA
jgi:hypothetical protein